MKIVHICMVDAFSDGWSYHRNIISAKNKEDGHDVTIVTSRYSMGVEGENVKEEPGVSYTKSGVKVVRLPDAMPYCPEQFQGRIRWTKGLFRTLCEEKPDIIMVHNLQFFNLGDVIRYKKSNEKVKLVGDTHASIVNSIPRGSKRAIFMHRIIYRTLIRKYFGYFDKFGYLSVYEKEFFENIYGIDMSKAELLPLPAPKVDRTEKQKCREEVRKQLGLEDDTFLFVHSGKMVKEKRTIYIFKALMKSNINCKLLLIGSIPDDMRPIFDKYIKRDKRIEYLGWKDADELRKIIAAADLYLQPGSVSVTLHNAMAAGTPVVAYPHRSYTLIAEGGEFFVRSPEDIKIFFDRIEEERDLLRNMEDKAYMTAEKYYTIEKNADFLYH